MLFAAVLLPFLVALIFPLFKKRRSIHPGWVALPVPVLLFILFLSGISRIRAGGAAFAHLPWMPSAGINLDLHLDGLSLLFTLLISGMGILVTVYSIFYIGKKTESIHSFYVYLLLFMGAMLGVVLSDNTMVLYGFWELTSVSSFLLIAFWHRKEKSRYGALKSMLITVFGGLAMLAGFLMLYTMTGTFSIRDTAGLVHILPEQPMFLPAMLLILLGAFTKSAQFPFHIWLPDAMEAPTPVSAYLHSATMVKAGLYLVARFSPVFAGQTEWFWLVSLTGLISLLYGSVKAVRQTDLKALLAYSTISQLGLIMCLLGLGSASAFYPGLPQAEWYAAATVAAVFHIVNHAAFKGTLFMTVGIIDHETGTRDIRRLGGLMTLLPITFTIALAGTMSMAGLPPFGGFLSKEMFFTSVLRIREFKLAELASWTMLFAFAAWIASVFTFVYSLILVLRTFGGKLQADRLDKHPHEASAGLWLPPAVLALFTLALGVFPNLLSSSLLEPAAAAIQRQLLTPGETFPVSIRFWHGWTPELAMTIGIVLVGFLVFKAAGRWNLLNRERKGLLSLDRLYDRLLYWLERGGARLTGAYMTGSRRHYLMYIFVFLIAALGGTLLFSKNITLGIAVHEYAPLSFYEGMILAVLLGAALYIPFAKSRVAAILALGATGYMVSLLFVILRAPDLALTQMIVETVSITLFLLCFRFLPKLASEVLPAWKKTRNAVIAIGVGAVMTLVALAALDSRPFASIADYYVKESYRLAGGKNIVNVILVDFRGFDTLFEIMVLGIATLAISGMIKARVEPVPADRQRNAGSAHDMNRLPRSNDLILKTAAKLAIPLIAGFSLYLFMAGHNSPGGGFIGALMLAAALVLMGIAFGTDFLAKVLPVNYRLLTAAGLLIAIATASGSFLFGVPFLTHTFGHIHLPLLGETELATAVLFDLGVYLSVTGVTMNMILSIGGDR